MERYQDFFHPRSRLLGFTHFLSYVFKRYRGDNCLAAAGALSYTTLLSAVPLIAIAFAVFAAFPGFADARLQLQKTLFENMVPQAGEAVNGLLNNFLSNASSMTAVGVVGMAVTAIITLMTIETNFNKVWRAERPRSLVMRVLIYWSLLTLGPVVMGASVALSTSASEIGQSLGPVTEFIWRAFALITPFLVQAGFFGVMYLIIPNQRVGYTNALVGGAVAALLFELLKAGFGYYVVKFPSYQAIYGALAAFPLTLFWMYLVWAVILFGASLAAAIPEWRGGQARPGVKGAESQTLLALVLLRKLYRAQADNGAPVSLKEMETEVGFSSPTLEHVLQRLVEAKLVAVASNNLSWVLSRDLSKISLYQLLRDMGGLPNGWRVDARIDEALATALSVQLERLDTSAKELFGKDIESWLNAN